ncbi:hypothetical protein [Methylobacterium sp. J-070]|uniref:hypothetical protein n=1 Tax=Methylobacterium sp. J-070 TaxID=2836650 RepID=UPI001FBBF79E|nr:hypothetical protein [Methylobacterium sp. J-070]MCJ2053974.1 hypothetical protein [Methylobacterium sp. J-070]
MTVQDDGIQNEPRIRRSWRERLILPMLVTGGLLTLTWIIALIAVALQMISAVAGTVGHG